MKGPATGKEDPFATAEDGDSLSILSGRERNAVCSGIAEAEPAAQQN